MAYVRPRPRTKYCGIYRILHVSTGASYIGGTVDVTGRFTHHRFMLRRGLHKSKQLQELWNKEGETAFRFEMIKPCEKAVLLDREQAWIGATPNLLNGSKSAITIHGFTDEQRRDMASKAAKTRWSNPAYKEKMLPHLRKMNEIARRAR